VRGKQVVQAMGRRVDENGFPECEECGEFTCVCGLTQDQYNVVKHGQAFAGFPSEDYQQEISALPRLELNGKSVTLVKDRIAFFRRWFNGYSLSTHIVKWDAAVGGRVLVSASVISDKGVAVSTGHAETTRKGSERDR
jgi:hypothetical protein